MIERNESISRQSRQIHPRRCWQSVYQPVYCGPCPWLPRSQGTEHHHRSKLGSGPCRCKARRVLFISGDGGGAKKEVETLLTGFGYSVIDLGNLRDGGLIQQAGPLAGRNLFEEGERHK